MTKKEIFKSKGKRVKIKETSNLDFYRGKEGIISIQPRGNQDDDEFRYGFQFEGGTCFQIPAGDYELL